MTLDDREARSASARLAAQSGEQEPRIVAAANDDDDDDYKTSCKQRAGLAFFTTPTTIRDHDQSRPASSSASIGRRRPPRTRRSRSKLVQMPQHRAHLRPRAVLLVAAAAAAATLLLLLLHCQPIDSIQFAGKSIRGNQRQHQQQLLLRFKRQANDDDSTAATTTAQPPTVTMTTTAAAPTTTTTTAAAAAAEAPGKIKPVNFTLVDELFDAVLSDSEVSAKWRHMDRQITDGVRAVLKAIFPHVVAMSQDAKVSGNCSGAILKWILNLRNLRSWAVKMLDSIGKPSAGLLEGSLTLFGNYKQCLGVRAPDEDEIEEVDGEFREYFRGQYCVLQMRPALPAKRPFYNLNSTIASLMRQSYKYYEKSIYDELAELAMAFHFVHIRADLCVPSLCSRDDIQRVADFLAKKVDMRARVARCDTEPMDDAGYSIDASQLIWCTIFVLLLLLVLISTSVSGLYSMRRVKPNKSRARSLATSMSLTRSLSHMKNIHFDRINESKPALLYSLRLIVVLWLCLVALVSQLDFQYLRELLPMRSIIMDGAMQLIVNSSLAFDSLVLLTAFTYSYSNINCNLIDLVKYNLGKYSRLMPSVMLLVALQIVTPLLYPNRSPVWHDFVDKPAQVCKSNGLINLLFLQNFLPYEQICLPQTWLLCVELQLCLLSIPIVYLLNKNFDTNQGRFKLATLPTIGLIYVALLGCVLNFLTIYWNSLPAAWFLTFPDKADRNLYHSVYLTKSWSHLSSFAVGLFAGHLCRCMAIDTFSGRPYGRRCCDNLMWLASALLMTGLIFSTHSWSLSGSAHLESPIASALYGSLGPLLWSLSWAMILFNLTVPSDKSQTNSMLARLLTCDLNLIRLGRLSFLAYLINPYVNMVVFAVQEQAIFSSILMLGHTLIGNLVLTFGIALLVSALVELPCRRLVKKLLLGSRRQCTNLGVITRQLNIHQQNQGPSHDSFVAQEKQRAPVGKQLQLQQQQPMIPLR